MNNNNSNEKVESVPSEIVISESFHIMDTAIDANHPSYSTLFHKDGREFWDSACGTNELSVNKQDFINALESYFAKNCKMTDDIRTEFDIATRTLFPEYFSAASFQNMLSYFGPLDQLYDNLKSLKGILVGCKCEETKSLLLSKDRSVQNYLIRPSENILGYVLVRINEDNVISEHRLFCNISESKKIPVKYINGVTFVNRGTKGLDEHEQRVFYRNVIEVVNSNELLIPHL